MNIFGVGGAELVLIFVIMLIVAGPKRMIRWAYVIGQYVGKFRILWAQMVDVLQDEVDAAGLDVKLPKDIPSRQSLAKTAADLIKPYAQDIEKSFDEVKDPIKETVSTANKSLSEAEKDAKAAGKIDMGVWGGKQAEASGGKPEEAAKPARRSAKDMNFGAWSQPEKPGHTSEREA